MEVWLFLCTFASTMPKEQEQSAVLEREEIDFKEPKRFKVIFHNDDFTTMEFVVELLMTVFHKSEAEAEVLMLKVHQEGQAVAGVYTLDMAKTKTSRALFMAQKANFPLLSQTGYTRLDSLSSGTLLRQRPMRYSPTIILFSW